MKSNRINNTIIALFFIMLTIANVFSLYIPKSLADNGDVLVIPNEAIRLRILANSNSEKDQEIKRVVRDRVNEQITTWVSELQSLDEAREVIVENLDELEQIARHVLEEYSSDDALKIQFGKVNFPTKLYGNFLYPAGEYEAVLITIGNGVGDNWWCVLFPPLCFLDFSSGSAVSEGFEDNSEENTEMVEESKNSEDTKIVVQEEEEPEVKFFLLELIDAVVGFIRSFFR